MATREDYNANKHRTSHTRHVGNVGDGNVGDGNVGDGNVGDGNVGAGTSAPPPVPAPEPSILNCFGEKRDDKPTPTPEPEPSILNCFGES